MIPLTKSRPAVLLDGPAPPRVLVAPNSQANSWEDVADLAASLGVPLDEWQEQVLEATMGERSNGKWASKYVGLSVPRQNGKSQIIMARALAGVLLFGERKIIISAHATDTAREVWQRIIDVIESNPWLEKRVTGRMNAIARESLTFDAGLDAKTIQLKARTLTGSRGFSADCLLLDEAQILGKSAWGSINPTVSARPNPQVWLFGTPPTDEDDPFAFNRVRESSIARKARHAWLEWSASPDDDFDSPDVWASANPAYGVRISREAIEDDRAAMDDGQFARERLGIWPSEQDITEMAVAKDLWKRQTIPVEQASGSWPLAAIGVDMDAEGWTWVTMVARKPDGLHVELLPNDLLAGGIQEAVEWLRKRARRRIPVVMPADSGATVLEAPLLAAKAKVYRLNVAESAQAAAGLVAALKDGTLTHLDDETLIESVESAPKEPLKRSPGQWRIGRAGHTNSAPLLAVACAHMGAVKWSRPGSSGATFT